MSRRLLRQTLPALIGLVVLVGVLPATAQESGRVVTPQGTFDSLAEALSQAREGDTVDVYGGHYRGSFEIDRQLHLVGHDWPVLDSGGRGTVVKITGENSSIRGFVIRNSGDVLYEENSGITVEAAGVLVENNRLEETLFGIYLRQATGSTIRHNIIHSKDLDVPRRGDPIRVWFSDGVHIENNTVSKGRDVVLWYSNDLVVRDNEIGDGRYGLHFMYCDNATIENNLLFNNSVGSFLMYSSRLRLLNNTIAHNRGPSGFGVGLKDLDDMELRDNLFLDNRVGAHLDNSPSGIDSIGLFDGNVFAFNDIGVNLMPSVRHNDFTGNSFVDNGEQVGIAGGSGGRLQDNAWSVGERGNYWSDYVGYDGDADGRGDVPYKAERLFESLVDQNPSLRLFVFSPAEQAIEFAARAFPFVRPQPKLSDDVPMMQPAMPARLPALPAASQWALWVASGSMLLVAAAVFFLTYDKGLAPRNRDVAIHEDGVSRGSSDPAPASRANNLNVRSEPMVQVKNLTKTFGKLTVIEELSFEVRAGEAVALWGANGAGKTTALRCLLGVYPYEGTIKLDGKNVLYHGKAARRLLGFVPQEISFHDDMTVEETLRFYARLKKTATQTEQTEQLLARLGLGPFGRKTVRDLSGGMKQRLALAIALLADPPLLVLDEPTANLDVRAREEFLALLAELKEAGKTLLFSSHRMEEIGGLADRVLVIESGRLVADCPPVELGSHLGNQAMLKLQLAGEEWIGPAVETLAGHGFRAQRNGTGVWVQVVPLEKAKPISLLTEAGIPVDDFQVE